MIKIEKRYCAFLIILGPHALQHTPTYKPRHVLETGVRVIRSRLPRASSRVVPTMKLGHLANVKSYVVFLVLPR